MASYGIRSGVPWFWDGFPNALYPVHLGWLPGFDQEENGLDDDVDLSDGWFPQGSYQSAIPKAGSDAVSWMMYGIPQYWPDLSGGTIPVYPPQAAASWTDVLQVIAQLDIRCWFGFDAPQRIDFFPPDVLGDINIHGLGHYSLGWNLEDAHLQQVTTLAVASQTTRTAPGIPAQSLSSYTLSTNPPYIPIYGINQGEGATLGGEIVDASTGPVFIGVILPGGLASGTFSGYSNLSTFLSDLLTEVAGTFPAATVHFVSTGVWSKNIAATLLGFEGGPVSVGGDNLWTNASNYSSDDTTVVLGDSVVCTPVKDLITTTTSAYTWSALTASYASNPAITPVPGEVVDWPAGDIYRHLIGTSIVEGTFASTHIVDLSHYGNYRQGMFVYSSFDTYVPAPTPVAAPSVATWHLRWDSDTA